MSFLAALVTSVYWPGIPGAATTPRWALLAIVPWLLRDQKMTPAHWFGLTFLLWAATTMLWNPAPLDGVGAIFVCLIWAACFCLGNQLGSLRPVYAGAAVGMGAVSLVALDQSIFNDRMLAGLMPVHGTFVNANYMGEAAALILVAVVAERMWWALPLVLPALALSEARGAILAAGIALAVHFRSHWREFLVVGALAGLAVALFTFYKDAASTPERLVIWQSALHGLTVFGRGIGSFWTQYPAFDLRLHPASFPENAHNEFLTIWFELGLVGLVIALGFCLTLAGPLDTSRLVLIALLTESCFAFPLHLPATCFIGMVVAGYAVRSRYLLRNLAFSRRLAGIGWRAASRPAIWFFLSRHGDANHAVRSPLS